MMAPIAYPKPEELDAIRSRPAAAIEASAGTGKTFLLVHLVVDLVLEGIPIDQILVVTFTEKATHELSRRVHDLLTTILAVCEGRVPPPDRSGRPAWTLDARAQARLQAALLAWDQAAISTIHGFCQKVLSENAFAHGRLFEQQSIDARLAFHTAFREALRESLALSESGGRALRVWLGTGRDAQALERLLHDAHTAERHGATLEPAFEPEPLAQAIGVFSALSAQSDVVVPLLGVSMHGSHRNQIRERLLLLSDAAKQSTAENSVFVFLAAIANMESAFRGRKDRFFPCLRNEREMLHAHLPRVGTAFEALDNVIVPLEAALVQTLLPAIAERLEQDKRREGLFDFQDLLLSVAHELEGASGVHLVNRLRGRYRAALIDEFQDTDAVQWRIFEKVFLQSDGANLLYVIGDPKQAIYDFRGADVDTYFAARNAIVAKNSPAHALRDNFRSTPDLIAACNEIFAPLAPETFFTDSAIVAATANPGRPSRRLHTGDGRRAPVVAWSVEPQGEGGLRLPALRAKLSEHIAAEAKRLVDNPPLLEDGDESHPVTASDIFILTRSGVESRIVGNALKTLRVPHVYYRPDHLFDTDEAKAIRDLLEAVADPANRTHRFVAFNGPFFSVPLQTLIGNPEILDDSALVERLNDFSAMAARRDYDLLFARLLDDTALIRRQLLLDNGMRTIVNSVHVFEVLLHEIGASRPSLPDVLRLLKGFIAGTRFPEGEDAGEQRLESDQNAIQIMTIHKAKGLEAAIVFVFGGFSRFLGPAPLHMHHRGGRRRGHVGAPRDEEIRNRILLERAAEEQRLMYVALTRAKGRLYLPYFPTLGEIDPSVEETFSEVDVFRNLDGPYRHVNRALRRLLNQSPLFEKESVLCPQLITPAVWPGSTGVAISSHEAPIDTPAAAPATASGPAPGKAPGLAPGTLLNERLRLPTNWRPPLLPSHRLSAIRAQHFGPATTSYTQLKHRAEGSGPIPREADEVVDDVSLNDEGMAAAPSLGTLPGGAAIGIFLHEVLEHVPLTAETRNTTAAEWLAGPEVGATIDRALRRHGLPSALREESASLVHAALTRPLPVYDKNRPLPVHDKKAGLTEILPGLCTLGEASMRECEFLYPDGDRDFVTGVIDVVFRHGGRVYAIDWKSDRLTPNDDAGKHVDRHYDLQAQLYSTALAKALGVNNADDYESRFGGILYVFLRRLDPSGVVFRRPVWKTAPDLNAIPRAMKS